MSYITLFSYLLNLLVIKKKNFWYNKHKPKLCIPKTCNDWLLPSHQMLQKVSVHQHSRYRPASVDRILSSNHITQTPHRVKLSKEQSWLFACLQSAAIGLPNHAHVLPRVTPTDTAMDEERLIKQVEKQHQLCGSQNDAIKIGYLVWNSWCAWYKYTTLSNFRQNKWKYLTWMNGEDRGGSHQPIMVDYLYQSCLLSVLVAMLAKNV